MSQSDLILAPESLEALLGMMGDLAPVLGPRAAGGLAKVRAHLEQAVAARHLGERQGALRAITHAMRELSELAGLLDPEEAAMMRAIAGQFEAALRRGDPGDAARSVDVMRQRSGAAPKPKE